MGNWKVSVSGSPSLCTRTDKTLIWEVKFDFRLSLLACFRWNFLLSKDHKVHVVQLLSRELLYRIFSIKNWTSQYVPCENGIKISNVIKILWACLSNNFQHLQQILKSKNKTKHKKKNTLTVTWKIKLIGYMQIR